MNFSSGQELLYYLKQKKAGIFLGGIVVVLIYVLGLIFYPKTFESSAVIYNSNKNKAETLAEDNTLQGLNESYTIINWVYSTELINHLISKFDLYKHYNIKKEDPEAYSFCFNKISRAISVNLTPYGAVKITVKNKDRFLAAAYANEIINQIDKLNEQKVIENRKYVIREYEFLLKEFSVDVSSQRDSIKKILGVLGQLSQMGNINKWKAEEVMSTLSNASKNYERLSSDWLTLRKVHLMSLKELEKFNLPNFVILQFALPEMIESPLSVFGIFMMLLVFVFGLWLTIVFLILRYKFSNDIKFVLGKNETNKSANRASKVYPINASASLENDSLKNLKENN